MDTSCSTYQPTISNRKIRIDATSDDEYDYFKPDVWQYSDYYPFGSPMPGRMEDAGEYRFGFNGKESDNEVSGNGNQYDYGFRIYNPRIGRFLSVDPLTNSYPWYTPYQFAGNKPIQCSDLDGLEEYYVINHFFINSLGEKMIIKVEFLPVPPNIQSPETKPGECYIYAEIPYSTPTLAPIDAINNKSWLSTVDKDINLDNYQKGKENGKLKPMKGDKFYDHMKQTGQLDQNLELYLRVHWEADKGDKTEDVRNKLETDIAVNKSLTRISDVAKMFSKYKISIFGNASPKVGTYKTNEQLANDRASAMKTVMEEDFGVNPIQLRSIGKGTSEADKRHIPDTEARKEFQSTEVKLQLTN